MLNVVLPSTAERFTEPEYCESSYIESSYFHISEKSSVDWFCQIKFTLQSRDIHHVDYLGDISHLRHTLRKSYPVLVIPYNSCFPPSSHDISLKICIIFNISR